MARQLPLLLLPLLLLLTPLAAQAADPPAGPAPFAPQALTEDDYARAEQRLSWNVNDLVYHVPTSIEWLDGDRFWYRSRIAEGHEFILVDPVAGTRQRAFDHERMAEVLSAAADTTFDAYALPITRLAPTEDGRGLGFELDRRRWECDVIDYVCERPATPIEQVRNGVLSPDGALLAFRRDHDLWVQDLASGEEIRLTTDGEEHYGYATDSEGWRRSARPAVSWSPDSRRIFTHRLDERGVGEMVLWRTTEGRPEPYVYKYAIPGDEVVPMYEWVIVDVPARTVTPVQAAPDHQRTSSCCGMLRGDAIGDVEWSADGTRLALVSTSRDYTTVALRLIDPATGAVQEVFEETVEPFFESSSGGRGVPNWRVFHERGQFLWHSPRDGHHHLYLYDLASGEQIRQLTTGPWQVVDVMHVDEDGGTVYFTAVGLEDGRDPYWRHFYSLDLDAPGAPTLLTPEGADHVVSVAPSGRFFVSTSSRLDQAPVTRVRAADGEHVLTAETADIEALLATGWPMPIPFSAMARDGQTEIYGVMYRPSNFDPDRRYPIVNNIYPGPQAGSIGPRTFQPGRRGNAQALAELGFIVVQIDALGTPMRGMDFHTYYYGDMADNGLADQIAAMRQLADRYDWIDIDRAGIYGHSGGGFATAAALLLHPEFFRVGVASAGNHDNRGYTYYWGEKWQGQLEPRAEGGDTYTNQAVHLMAGALEGKLLLSYGTMDSNVHPVTTLLLVDELIRHNKDFDLMVFPNRGHGYANEPYNLRITWDYFVRHLLGAEPPAGYRIAN
jgi:dipeptidyl-peptidase 4